MVMSMTKTAFVFPGQGSQFVGMGKDLYEGAPVAREAFELADEVLGIELKAICFEGPAERLRETRYTQPAILVHSVAIWRMLEAAGALPDYVAGHSVGEYSALVASGALGYEDALRLVQVRGEAMFASGVEKPGAMAAIIGVPDDKLEGFLEEAGEGGVIKAANYNSPVQIVVSGDVAAVDKAVEIARGHGAKRAIKLNVSGAFHSPLMESAEEQLARALDSVGFSEARIPIVTNVTARAVVKPADIAECLRKQLTSPVLWRQSMEYLTGLEVNSFVEVGPGNVLCGLLKRIEPSARCISCSDRASVESYLGEVVT
jgi:[acyl-carrier-protein] S-malonyltransferase